MKRQNCIRVSLAVTGVVLLAFGLILGYGIFPIVVEKLVREELNIWNPESEGSMNFEKPPVPIYMKFYFFDVQNPEKFADGSEKAILVEKGPYTYREIRKKVNQSNSIESECYIRAGQYKAYIFDQEMSCKGCSHTDNVTIPNVPLIGLASKFTSLGQGRFLDLLNKVSSTGSPTGNISHPSYSPDYKDSVFITAGVNDLLFGGYKLGGLKYFIDKLWASIDEHVPPQIKQDNGFAFFNGKNDTAYFEYYEFDTGYCPNESNISDYSSSDMQSYMQIRKWGVEPNSLNKDLTSMKWWKENGSFNGSNICNKLEGTDGQQFQPGLKEDDKIVIFQTDLCRTMHMTYQGDFYVEGIPTYRFAPPPAALQVNTTANIGFCMEFANINDCVKETDDPDVLDTSNCFKDNPENPLLNKCYDGILNISSCNAGAPVVLSSPYFYQSPDFFREEVGLEEADPDLHETRLYIEPTVGMTIKLEKRIQINLAVVKSDKIDLLKNVKETLFPLLWLQEEANIDEANVDKLFKMVVTPTRLVFGIQWTCVVVGILLVLGVIVHLIARGK